MPAERSKDKANRTAGAGGEFEEPGTDAPEAGTERELRLQLRDLEIANRVKDDVIERYESEREAMLDRLTGQSRQIGILETELRVLKAPTSETPAE